MNQWMDNARQRVELVCLAMFVGTVLFSGCSHNRSAEGGFPFWTRVSRTTDITSAVHSSPLIASASASSLPHSAETKVSSASVPSAYPPLHFASETPAPPEPEAVSQPLAPPLEVAKIDPRPAAPTGEAGGHPCQRSDFRAGGSSVSGTSVGRFLCQLVRSLQTAFSHIG